MLSKRVVSSVTIDIATGAVESSVDSPYCGPWALCEEAPGGTPAKTEVIQPALPGVVSDVDKIRADKAEAALAELKAANAKLASEAKTRKAVDDGKVKEELDARTAELEKYKADHAALQETIKARVDRGIASLPKELQEEIALVRDDLPLAKLEMLVDRKSAGLKPPEPKEPKGPKAPPTPGVGSHSPRPQSGHELHPETKETLRDVFAKPRHYEVGAQLGVDSVGKFGWGRTDNENESKANFIHLLDSISAVPVGGRTEDDLASRVLKKS